MLFGGKLTSVLVCQKCKHISQTYEDFNDLSLSLKAEDYAKERKRDRFKKLARKMGMPVRRHKDDSRKISQSSTGTTTPGIVPEEPIRPSLSPSDAEKPPGESSVPMRPSSVPPSPAPSGLDRHEPPLSIDVSRRRSLDGIRVSSDSAYKESDDEDGAIVVIQPEDVRTEISPLSSTSSRDKPLPPSPGSHPPSPDDRKIEFADAPKVERSEKEKDKSKAADSWARLGRRISLTVGIGKDKDKSGKSRSRSRTRKNGESGKDGSSTPQIRLSRPSISPERSSTPQSFVQDGKENTESDSGKKPRSRPHSLSPTASSTAVSSTAIPMFQRSKSPKPPKPSRAEAEYLRAILADVTAAPVTVNHPLAFFQQHHTSSNAEVNSVGSSSSSVPSTNPGLLHSATSLSLGSAQSTSNALANNLWMKLGQLPLPGVEECLKMFTAVEVLDGENMVGCRRCWKIANGWYDEDQRAKRREERRRRREMEEDNEEDNESDEDGRDGDESADEDDDGDDDEMLAKNPERSTEDESDRHFRLASSAPTSPSFPHEDHSSMYTHQNVSDGFSLNPQGNDAHGSERMAPPPLKLQYSSNSTSTDGSGSTSPALLTARPGGPGFAAIKGELNPGGTEDLPVSSNGVNGNRRPPVRREDSYTPSSTDYSTDDGESDAASVDTTASASVSVRSAASSTWTSVSPAGDSSTSRSSSSHRDQTIQAPALQMSRSEPTSVTSQTSSQSPSNKPTKSKQPKPTLMRPAYKRYLIATPPPILVIHLKRFQQVSKVPMMSFSTGFKKMDDYVAFPEFLDLTPFMAPKKEDFGLGSEKGKVKDLKREKERKKGGKEKERVVYRLYAVVVHIGNMVGAFFPQVIV